MSKNKEKVCTLRASQMSMLCMAVKDPSLYSRDDLVKLVEQQQKQMDKFIDSLPEVDD